MPSPEAIFEREAVRSYMVTDLWDALGHDVTDPRIAAQGVDFVQLWAELIAEVRSLRRSGPEPDHECDFPPGITATEQRYYVCPVCDTHWVKVKRMVGRQMYRSWHRMSPEQVARWEAERRNVRPA